MKKVKLAEKQAIQLALRKKMQQAKTIRKVCKTIQSKKKTLLN
jgi:hypothetical protein